MNEWLANLRLPPGLTEDDLIDMVDGTLPPEREPGAVAAVRAEPRLGLLIKQMRADRAALIGQAAGPVPSGLRDSVLAAVDDHALRDVADEESHVQTDRLPISAVRVDGSFQGRRASDNRLVRVAALAAAVAIVGGSVVYFARELRPATNTRSPTSLALNSDAGPELKAKAAEPEPRTPAVALADVGDVAARNSSSQGDGAGGSLRTAESVAAGPVPAPAGVTQQIAAAAVGAGAPETSVSPAAAVRMAREGRLALVVRPKDAQTTLRRLETMARAGTQTSGPGHTLVWRSMTLDRLPPSLAVLTSQLNSTARRRTESRQVASSPDRPPAVASDAPAGKNSGSGPAPSPTATFPAPAIRAVFSVEVDPSQRALSELVALLGEDGANQILYRVAETAMSPTISLDPEAMLWWTGPPSRWVRPAVVPIIIDVRD